MQTTFVMIKPDGVQRGLVADIIGRFETKGLRLVGLRQLTPPMELAEAHYEVHNERPFYSGLIEFITSGPVVAMAWTGVDAILLPVQVYPDRGCRFDGPSQLDVLVLIYECVVVKKLLFRVDGVIYIIHTSWKNDAK